MPIEHPQLFKYLAEDETRLSYQFRVFAPYRGHAFGAFRPSACRAHPRQSRAQRQALCKLRQGDSLVAFCLGSERGLLIGNPASGIKDIRRKKDAPEANRPWADQERDATLEGAPDHTPGTRFNGVHRARSGGCSHLATGVREGWRDRDHALKDRRAGFLDHAGTAGRYSWQSASLNTAITLCANSRGRPWTLSGFNASWRTLRTRLDKEGRIGPGLTLYGLRHTVAVILRESGADERAIADALGQKTIEMARHYAKGANLTRKMRGVVKNFDEELARRRTEK